MTRQYPQDPFGDTEELAGLTGVSGGQQTRSPGESHPGSDSNLEIAHVKGR